MLHNRDFLALSAKNYELFRTFAHELRKYIDFEDI